MKTALPLLALLAVAAAPADTALRDRIVAEAAAQAPATLAFDRATVASRSGGGETASQARVDRWDGKAWSVVSIDGKPPSVKDAADAVKALAAMPVPGYNGLATLLAKAVPAIDARGRAVLRADAPTGSVFTSGKDVSENFIAEATIGGGNRPFVEQLRMTAKAPFRLMMVAKIERMTAVSDYARDAQGRPRLLRRVTEVDGSMFGTSGRQRNEATFTYH